MMLPPYAEQLLASALRSTQPSSCKAAWREWFDHRADDADRRAENGPRSAQKRSDHVRGLVRAEIASMRAAGEPLTASAVKQRMGWPRGPDIELIREEIRTEGLERDAARIAMLLSALKPDPAQSWPSSTSPST